MIFSPQEITGNGIDAVALRASATDSDRAKFIIDYYLDNKKSCISTCGINNVINAHQFYINNKLSFYGNI